MLDDNTPANNGREDSSMSENASAPGSGTHEDSSTFNHSSTEKGSDLPDDILTSKETRAVKWSRLMVLAALTASAIVSGAMTWYWSNESEMDDFEARYDDFSYEIEDLSSHTTLNIYKVAESFSKSITSTALSLNQVFPNVTVPHFEVKGEMYRSITDMHLVAYSPIVKDLKAWNEYSVSEQGWIEESYRELGEENVPSKIEEMYYKSENGDHFPEKSGQVEYSPLWMVAPAPLDTSAINFNLLSHDTFRDLLDVIRDTSRPVLSPILEASDLLGEGAMSKLDGSFHPESLYLQPVFDSFDESAHSVVGIVISLIRWDVFFGYLLHERGQGIVCVLKDTCGGMYSYQSNGSVAIYLGEGDLHDTAYTHLEHSFAFGLSVDIPVTKGDDHNNDHRHLHGDEDHTQEAGCHFTVHVFPTWHLEEEFHTNQPAILTTAIVFIFAFTGLVFILYDYLVERRQERVHSAAVKSNAIVSSLFPAEVRDRLFQNDREQEQHPSGSKGSKKFSYDVAPKFRLKTYLSDDRKQDSESDTHNAPVIPEMYETKPIADLFPHTTVMFADIAGFTAWSSVREPSQVFTLLETVYRAFDTIAKRRRVFKVETVGDCYVAVTGLPEPRKDHATVMARFARDCMIRMNELTHQLEVTLGPDTGDLAMRFGLHSGPVTAGVLRGDKSRFQLFGDTVNTAARMESTGMRNRIHISQETADQLKASGKEQWYVARNDVVIVKGKGAMKTFWLFPKERSSVVEFRNETPERECDTEHLSLVNNFPVRSQTSPKIQRLVDWNVDVLKRILRLILAQRTSQDQKGVNLDALRQEEEQILNKKVPLEDVQEIVTLPAFNAKTQRTEMDPITVPLPPTVVEQLSAYVEAIATMYRENPFHNFEHASHVTMSVSKLLSRIVAPDIDIKEGHDVAADLHDHTYGITSDPLTQFAVVISALVHDVDHVGLPNFLLVNENQELGTRYDNKSVAEQNSVDLAWTTLMDPIFKDLRQCLYTNTDELKRFRQLMVNTVLATDIFDKELQALRKNRWEKAFKSDTSSEGQVGVNRKATIVIEHLIQASDVAHTMQHWHIYQKWNERLFAEMMMAYRSGRSSNDPSTGWYKGELGFFDNYVIPLAKKLKECGVFGVSSDEYLNYALENRREWAIKGEEVVATMIKKYYAAVGVQEYGTLTNPDFEMSLMECVPGEK